MGNFQECYHLLIYFIYPCYQSTNAYIDYIIKLILLFNTLAKIPIEARSQLEFPLLGYRARQRWRRKRDVPHVVGGDGEVDADPVALQQ